MMKPSFDIFDHTADLGIRVQAGSQAKLLQPAAQGLYSVIGDLKPGEPVRSQRIELDYHDPALLLRDFLTELLILFDSEHLMVNELEKTAFDDTSLSTTVNLVKVDDDCSSFHREVKAVTYHGLKINAVDGGFEAEIIVDI